MRRISIRIFLFGVWELFVTSGIWLSEGELSGAAAALRRGREIEGLSFIACLVFAMRSNVYQVLFER